VSVPLYEALAMAFVDAGIETAFGLMGEDTAKLVTTYTEQPGTRFVHARHESMAVAMADGYARLSGGFGLAVLSRGPGLVNGLTAAIAARKHRTGLVVVTGDSPATEALAGAGARYPKHVAQSDIARACGLVAERVESPDDAERAVRAALDAARAGRAAVLNVPTDLFDAEVELDVGRGASVGGRAGGASGSGGASADGGETAAGGASGAADPADLDYVVDLLRESERPLLIAGRGAHEAGAAPAIQTLADRIGALTGTSLLAKGLFGDAPFDVGILGGFAGEAARRCVRDADVVIAFGASLNGFTTGGGKLLADARVVQVDLDPGQIGATTAVERGVIADARAFAEALAERVAPADGARSEDVRDALAAYREEADFDDASLPGAADPRTLARALDEALPRDRALVVDAGAFSGYVSRYVGVPDPSRFAFCLDFSAVGLAHGTALGAAVARPDSTTVLFIGDGGLFLTLGELETAVREEIPLVIVVLDDGAYGAERHYLDIARMPNRESLFATADFAAVAEALGMSAVVVESADDVARVPPVLAARRGPLLVDCKINGELRPQWLEELYTASGYGR
jgi:acetolactate synthase-1/2/3 large subunit